MNVATKRRWKMLGDGCKYFSQKAHLRENPPDGWHRKAVMGETSGTIGGYTVPVEVQAFFDEQLMEFSIFHRLARQQPMKHRQCNAAGVDLSKLSASAATDISPLFGGLSINWVKENTSISESTPSQASFELVAGDLTVLVPCTNQLIQDGGEALGAYLEPLFTNAIVWSVERACFRGSGQGQPLGIVIAPCSKLVNRTLTGHIVAQDVATMSAGLLPACFARSIWVCHPGALADLLMLPSNVFSQTQHLEEKKNPTRLAGSLACRPLYVTENLYPLGTKGDLVLFDPMLYVLGTRSLEIDRAEEVSTYFQSNESVYKLWWRGDGQPLIKGVPTDADGATTSSGFVVLN